MCIEQFCGLEFIFELFLQKFLFIQSISANNFPTNYGIVTSVKAMVEFDDKYDILFKMFLEMFIEYLF